MDGRREDEFSDDEEEMFHTAKLEWEPKKIHGAFALFFVLLLFLVG